MTTAGEEPAQPGADHGLAGNITLHPSFARGKSQGPREVAETARAARRFIRAVGRKIAEAGDPEDVDELLALERTLTDALHTAVHGLRRQGRSDGEIARALRITRQAVSQRFPR